MIDRQWQKSRFFESCDNSKTLTENSYLRTDSLLLLHCLQAFAWWLFPMSVPAAPTSPAVAPEKRDQGPAAASASSSNASAVPATAVRSKKDWLTYLRDVSWKFVEGKLEPLDDTPELRDAVADYLAECDAIIRTATVSQIDEMKDKFVDDLPAGDAHVQEYGSGEHYLLGSQLITLPAVVSDFASIRQAHPHFRLASLRIGASQSLQNGVAQFAFGEIIALAGDFICIEEKGSAGIISDAPSETIQERFRVAFDMLWKATLADRLPSYVSCVKGILAEAAAIEEARARDPQYKKSANPTDAVYKSCYRTLYLSELDWAQRLGDRSYLMRYFDALSNNFDHFNFSRDPPAGQERAEGPATRTYRAGHSMAMHIAAAAGGSWLGLNEAMCVEAFACHFLTDSFAVGHVRTPRRELMHACDYWVAQEFRAGLRAHDMHDEDGQYGVYISSSIHPDPWKAYGDGALFHSDNAFNRDMCLAAMHAALLDVRDAFLNAKVPAAEHVLAWQHLPRYAADPRNFPPMFKVVVDSSKKDGFYVQKRTSKRDAPSVATYDNFSG
jgi:hypothetical protein